MSSAKKCVFINLGVKQCGSLIHSSACIQPRHKSVPQGAGFCALCSVLCTQPGSNLEMSLMEDSSKINFSNSASLTGASADITRLSGFVI